MRIIFSSITCSNAEYLKVQKLKHKEKLNPSQKYFDMLLKGLASHENVSISCVTARFIASSNCKKKFLSYKKEIIDAISYFYIPIVNFPLIRNFFNFIFGFLFTAKLCLQYRNEYRIFVADPLVYDISYGALLAARLFRLKKCAVVTDLPTYMAQIDKDGNGVSFKKKIKSSFMNNLIAAFDCYVFLTESMNVVNCKKKPYVIIEGMTYVNSSKITPKHVENNIVLYAGGLYEQFGIKTLVEASKKINVPNFELHLYGEGNCIDYINSVSKDYPHVKYMGTLTLEEIVCVESNAKILINPRPSSEKFTEFSFPSKTIEYMSTGRPVLTTPLKGIPKEYFDYLFVIDDESTQGFVKNIEECLCVENDRLDEIGLKSMNYVCNKKNNFVLSERLLQVLKY